jgi:hypothetical protein
MRKSECLSLEISAEPIASSLPSLPAVGRRLPGPPRGPPPAAGGATTFSRSPRWIDSRGPPSGPSPDPPPPPLVLPPIPGDVPESPGPHLTHVAPGRRANIPRPTGLGGLAPPWLPPGGVGGAAGVVIPLREGAPPVRGRYGGRTGPGGAEAPPPTVTPRGVPGARGAPYRRTRGGG